MTTSKKSKKDRDSRSLALELRYFMSEVCDEHRSHRHSRHERRQTKRELVEASQSRFVLPIMREGSLRADSTRYQMRAETAFDERIHPKLPTHLRLKPGVLLDTAIHPEARERIEDIFRAYEKRCVDIRLKIEKGELTWS